MGVKRIGLEYHGDIPIFWRDIIHDLVVDQYLAVADIFQTSQTSQGGRLSAAGRTNQNKKFFVDNLDVKIVDSHDFPEALCDVVIRYACHWIHLLSERV
jgi:hypothetical protein